MDQLGLPVYACPVSLSGNAIDQLTQEVIKVAQDLDPTNLKSAIKAGKIPLSTTHGSTEVALICREASKLQLGDGLLNLSFIHSFS